MNKEAEERGLHDLFEIGVVLKAIDGALELVGGAALSLLSPAALDALVRFLFRGELIEDPKDWLVNELLHLTQNLSGGFKAYAAALLVAHGAVKLAIVAGLLRGKLWAYPVGIWVFAGFVAWQLYELSLAYSLLLWIVTIVDALVILLIWHEYRKVKQAKAAVG